ncbi:MAG: Crp/Fnr family transcriptional regulator [Bdellovibrionaceae bacterium]|nr:Crp/Fnr family transcriptional regulator [Pseudobdellovibrionaceae bacterium]NUM59471.1 Crp/Fnr family transcriptional regulator [Pseudobdellovibrionaceae bacterium]
MAESKKIPKDNYLFRDGDTPDFMYIVKSGQFVVTKAKGSSEIILAEIKAGNLVGEMAIFDKKPRSANVKAMKDSEVIALPYETLNQQLENLPVWVKAILRNLNENLREANKRIKLLESSNQDDERFPPHVINKFLSILNFIGNKYGSKEDEGLIIPQNRLRNTTIQIFQEATNKMQSIQSALQEMSLMKIEELGEGRQKIVILKPDLLFDFVDWYNDWLFKNDKDKVSFSSEEIKTFSGIINYAKKIDPNPKGVRKVNVNDLQNDSMKELGFLLKVEDLNPLIEKHVVSEKIMEEGGVFVNIILDDIEKMATYWKMIWDFKKHLR